MRHAISFLRVVVAVVIVVFALIGFLYVTRGGAVKRVRGVGVTSGTVSPVEPEFALSVAMATGRAARARYDRLLAAGVRVFEWQPTALHAKTFVVDELWSSVGTMNFDNRSLVLNEEVTLMVLDPAFGHDMNAMFLDDLQHATEITRDEFRKRPWTERVVERGANVVARVL